MDRQAIDEILDFWFGADAGTSNDAIIADKQAMLWWQKHPNTDADIRGRFELRLLAAETGVLHRWREDPQGLVALILLTDQFSRNMYRDTPDAFRFDALAREYCLEALDTGKDKALRPIHRVFCYLPLEHSENREHQDRCVTLYRELADSVPESQRKPFLGFLDYAEQHRVIIERFGRFPHRNVILGRPSTAEEVAFLRQPGSSF